MLLRHFRQKANKHKEVNSMKKENEKYSLSKMYLKEFSLVNSEYDITFNIVDIDIDRMTINVVITDQGKISVNKYDLKKDKNENLFFEYGHLLEKINIDDFETIND
ncbi:MAG TPA: hypothetical protein IAB72_01440 [Candidatus Onthoplasma faecipullorum]|nr:hypothetical protein [Candidatus Onthoplasma faecipullorum]